MEAKINQAHIPVMTKEVMSFLDINPNGKYVDGTCGLGGHSKLIQNELSKDGILIALDIDNIAIQSCKSSLSETNSKLYIKREIINYIEIKKNVYFQQYIIRKI